MFETSHREARSALVGPQITAVAPEQLPRRGKMAAEPDSCWVVPGSDKAGNPSPSLPAFQVIRKRWEVTGKVIDA